jgi:hypothetical protein
MRGFKAHSRHTGAQCHFKMKYLTNVAAKIIARRRGVCFTDFLRESINIYIKGIREKKIKAPRDLFKWNSEKAKKTKAFCFQLDIQLKERIYVFCNKRNISLTVFFNKALINNIEKNKNLLNGVSGL